MEVKQTGQIGKILLAVVMVCTFVAGTAAQTWTPTGTMTTGRAGHVAVLLQNGKMLVAGGANTLSFLSSAELYDPLTGTWTSTGSMTTARVYHTAAVLLDGSVLVTGGFNSSAQALSSAEVYDPLLG